MVTRHDLVDVQIHPHKYAHAANFKYFKQMELYHQFKNNTSPCNRDRDRINSMVFAPTAARLKTRLSDDKEAEKARRQSIASDDSEEWNPHTFSWDDTYLFRFIFCCFYLHSFARITSNMRFGTKFDIVFHAVH